MKKLFTILLLLIYVFCNGQNLVLNPSFEDSVSCPLGPDDMNTCAQWSSYKGSPDYYYAGCPMSVPDNWGGHQFAASGNAYCGVATYVSVSPNYREFVGSMLSSPLIVGTKYYISIKIALSIDEAVAGNCASNKMGAMFSTNSYDIINPSPITNNPPIYTDSIITDSTNWTMIFGSFIADSAYSHIILGNFFDDNHTSTIHIASGFFEAVYYFLDDICVSTDSVYAYDYIYTGIETKESLGEIKVYPNPSTNLLNISSPNNEQLKICLYDTSSKNIFEQNFTKTTSINIEHLAKGIYFFSISDRNGQTRTGKIIRQ